MTTRYAYGYCGMPCALCTRYRINGSSRCPGCSVGGYYTEGCKVFRCCREHDEAHCGVCAKYPCAKLGRMADFRDLDTGDAKRRACTIVAEQGCGTWYTDYVARAAMLDEALERYNDGRMKRYLCELFLQNDRETLERVMNEARALTGDKKALGAGFRALAEALRAKEAAHDDPA